LRRERAERKLPENGNRGKGTSLGGEVRVALLEKWGRLARSKKRETSREVARMGEDKKRRGSIKGLSLQQREGKKEYSGKRGCRERKTIPKGIRTEIVGHRAEGRLRLSQAKKKSLS